MTHSHCEYIPRSLGEAVHLLRAASHPGALSAGRGSGSDLVFGRITSGASTEPRSGHLRGPTGYGGDPQRVRLEHPVMKPADKLTCCAWFNSVYVFMRQSAETLERIAQKKKITSKCFRILRSILVRLFRAEVLLHTLVFSMLGCFFKNFKDFPRESEFWSLIRLFRARMLLHCRILSMLQKT